MFWVALLLGLVEGLTEFLPISSTGHLILTSSIVGLTGSRAEVFPISIQVGAILAVVWEYRARLRGMLRGLGASGPMRGFAMNLAIAFVPSAILGVLFHDWMLEHLFTPASVAAALIVGGIMIFVVEGMHIEPRIHEVEKTSWRQALGIGLAQCLALWPGFSRSSATILGGLVFKLDRRASTEFSFFLAIPTMFAATSYHLLGSYQGLPRSDLGWLVVSLAISFVVALISIRWLLRFVSNHSFRPFGWYRLLLGVIILWVLNEH